MFSFMAPMILSSASSALSFSPSYLIGEKASKLGTLLEIHIDDLEADFPLACSSEQSLNSNVTQTEL